MPNTGHKWTKDEDEASLLLDWPEFNERFNEGLEAGDPEYISWNAWRQRRGYLQRQARIDALAVSRRNEPTLIRPKDDFIGLTVGYFDIETTFSNQPRMLYAAVADQWGNITEFDRDSYPGSDPLLDDSEMVVQLVDHLETYDIVVSWNGKMFDVPVINGRLAIHKLPRRYRPRMHIDLMYQAGWGKMKIGKRSLEHVGNVFGAPNQKTPLDVRTWDAAVTGDDEAYEKIREHCNADVLLLRDVFGDLKYGIQTITA